MTTTPTIEQIDVDEIDFDPDNPRRPSAVDPSDQSAVLRWLLLDGSVLELMGSVGSYGFFVGEPLLVAPNPNGRLIAVEGNRRLAAAKLLNNPSLAPVRTSAVQEQVDLANTIERTLPVIRFESRNEILDYLGYRHVTGIKEWTPLAKARYLQQLAERRVTDTGERPHLRDLARLIGSTAPYVGRLLVALGAYDVLRDNGFFHGDLNEEQLPFSLLSTSLNYPNIVRFLGLDDATDSSLTGLEEENLLLLGGWLYKKDERTRRPRVPESRQIRVLDDVLGSDRAIAALVEGAPLREAALLTRQPEDTFREAVSDIKSRLRVISGQLDLIEHPTQDDLLNVQEIGDTVAGIAELLQRRLTADAEA